MGDRQLWSSWVPVAVLMLLASFPPALLLVHGRIARLPVTAPLALMNYDAFAWYAAYRAARAYSRIRPSTARRALTVATFVGLVLSGLYLITVIGLCGPAVLVFRCHA